jgi:fimbrial chaperone protein
MFSAHKKFITVLVCTVLTFSTCPPASAGVFNVKPIRLFLSKDTDSVILTIHNQDTQPLRVQVAGVTWSNTRDGQPELKPTDDLIVFPTLVTINALDVQNIRIGFSGTPPRDTELTYRITIDELPSLESQLSKEHTAGLLVRTRITVPVFFEPDTSVKKAQVDELSLRRGVAHAIFTNSGNFHVVVRSVEVTGRGAGGAKVFSKDINGWYVLAGESRDYQAAIPSHQCAELKTLSVSVQTDAGSFSRNATIDPAECR